MEFIFDGWKYAIGCSYGEFYANGWQIDLIAYGIQDGFGMAPGKQSYTLFDLQSASYGIGEDAFRATVGFENATDIQMDITNCSIWRFKADTKYGSIPYAQYADMEIAGGIRFGSTLDEVIAAFGEPQRTVPTDNGYMTLTYTNGEDYMTLVIYTDGGVSSIELGRGIEQTS